MRELSSTLLLIKQNVQHRKIVTSLIMMIQFSDTLNGIQTAFFKEKEYLLIFQLKKQCLQSNMHYGSIDC